MKISTIITAVLVLYGLYYAVMFVYEYFTAASTGVSTDKEEDIDIGDIVTSFQSVKIDADYLSGGSSAQTTLSRSGSLGRGFTPEEIQAQAEASFDKSDDVDTTLANMQNWLQAAVFADEEAA